MQHADFVPVALWLASLALGAARTRLANDYLLDAVLLSTYQRSAQVVASSALSGGRLRRLPHASHRETTWPSRSRRSSVG